MNTSFSDLGVPARLVARLAQQGIVGPFPIQAATIPNALAGRDVCGRAPTRSGRPSRRDCRRRHGHRIDAPPTSGASVVPTRELASQVQGEIALLAGERGNRTIAI